MPTKFWLAAALVASIAHDIKITREYNEAVSVFTDAHTHFVNLEVDRCATIRYLCNMLDEHDIPVDEFDLIALNFHQS